MLQAMNTGHDGSLTTIHANSARDAISRIETMVLMAGFELPIRAIREQIASAIDIVVQISRMRDGSRKVVGISEIVGMEGDVVTMQEIVRYQQRGLDKNNKVVGEFEFTGVQPECLRRFAEFGVSFDMRSFSEMGGGPARERGVAHGERSPVRDRPRRRRRDGDRRSRRSGSASPRRCARTSSSTGSRSNRPTSRCAARRCCSRSSAPASACGCSVLLFAHLEPAVRRGRVSDLASRSPRAAPTR